MSWDGLTEHVLDALRDGMRAALLAHVRPCQAECAARVSADQPADLIRVGAHGRACRWPGCGRRIGPGAGPYRTLCDECLKARTSLGRKRRTPVVLPLKPSDDPALYRRLYAREYQRRVRRHSTPYMEANAARVGHKRASRLPLPEMSLSEARQCGLRVVDWRWFAGGLYLPGTDRRDAEHDAVLSQLEAESLAIFVPSTAPSVS